MTEEKTKPDPPSELPSPVEGEERQDRSTKAGRASGQKSTTSAKRAKSKRTTQKDLLARLQEKNKLLLALQKDKAKLENEVKALRDKWLRALADFENYRKRTRKEQELLIQRTKSDVIAEILEVIDDFERAFSVVVEGENDFVQGIRLIHKNLISTLEKMGVRPIEALNTPFDPNYHMAVGQVESKEHPTDHVVKVVQKGYLIDDAVLRPAKVVIAK